MPQAESHIRIFLVQEDGGPRNGGLVKSENCAAISICCAASLLFSGDEKNFVEVHISGMYETCTLSPNQIKQEFLYDSHTNYADHQFTFL